MHLLKQPCLTDQSDLHRMCNDQLPGELQSILTTPEKLYI